MINIRECVIDALNEDREPVEHAHGKKKRKHHRHGYRNKHHSRADAINDGDKEKPVVEH